MNALDKKIFRILDEERVSPTARLNLGQAIMSTAECVRLDVDNSATYEAINDILTKLALATGETSVDDHVDVVFCDTRVVDTLSYAKHVCTVGAGVCRRHNGVAE